MAFDPDAYLAAKTAPEDDSGFDPDAYLEAKGTPAPAPTVDVGRMARAATGRPPGPRELTSEEAGTSAGLISSDSPIRPGMHFGPSRVQQPIEPAAAPEDYVTRKALPGGGVRLTAGTNPNEMADPLVQMGTATALGMASGAGAAGLVPHVLAPVVGAGVEGAVANKAMGGDADTGAALGLLPLAVPKVARAVGGAGRVVGNVAGKVVEKIGPSAEKAIKNARGWVVKDISGDIKSASTSTARKQLADDAENAATIVLKDRPLGKAIDRAESGNLDRLQAAQGEVQTRLKSIAQEKIAPKWEEASKALPNGGVRSGDLVDFVMKRSEDLRATGLTSDAAEADALDAIAGRVKKAKNWGGGMRYDPAAPVQGGGLDGMETGKAISLLEKQKTGPTVATLDDEIKRLRAGATVEGFNPDTIVPAQQIQKLWADEAGNAYKSYGGINGTAAFERKLDIASHLREFRDGVLADVAKADPTVAGELRAANRDYSALKRVENVLDQRINHAKANAQGASIPAGLKKAVKDIKHSPTGFAIAAVPEALIAGKRAFDKWVARRALTAQETTAVRKIFAPGAKGRGPAVRAAVAAGVPSSIAMFAARAADGGAKVQNVASDEAPPAAVAEAP